MIIFKNTQSSIKHLLFLKNQFMDNQYRSVTLKFYENQLRNVLIRTMWISITQLQQFQVVFKNEYLQVSVKRHKLDFNHTIKNLAISKLHNITAFETFVQINVFKNVQNAYLLDSDISSKVLNYIIKNWTLKQLGLIGCKIEPIFIKQMCSFPADSFKSLYRLTLQSLLINNSDLKQLTKINFPSLTQLVIHNLNITGDIFKVLIKIANNNLRIFSLVGLKTMFSNQQFKQLFRVVNFQQQPTCIWTIINKQQAYNFVHLGHISKMNAKQNSRNKLVFE